MNRDTLLSHLRQAIQAGEITRQDVLDVLDAPNSPESRQLPNRFGQVLSYLGAFILVLGIVFFISLFWSEMQPALQIAVTLGLGLAIFGLSNYLLSKKQFELPALALHIVPPVLIPYGITITIQTLFPSDAPQATVLLIQTLIFTGVTGLYALSDYLFRKELLTFISWILGSISYGVLVAFCIQAFNIPSVFLYDWRGLAWFFLTYGVTILGVAYLLETSRSMVRLPFAMYLIGTVVTLGSIFAFVADRPFWEALYVLPLMLTLYGGVVSRKMVVIAVAFFGIFAFVSYINIRYFVETVSWPISLIVIGLSLIGLGYAFHKVKLTLKT